MKPFLYIFFLFPLAAAAHPGVGIVRDSRGIIYYTDLKQVWKIDNGTRTIAVEDVHTHELYIDRNDNLYGEGGYYDELHNKFFHYLWVYRADGSLDTAKGMKEAYVLQDFSLARDKQGNEYYLKRFLKPHTDTGRIYKRYPGEPEEVFATGNFKNVNWLHPQDDGTVLFVSQNAIYRATAKGDVKLIRGNVGDAMPSFKFSGNSITIWGVWQDKQNNVYAAVFSDQAIKKIHADGSIKIVYRSTGNWTPLHGVFDNYKRLWVLEGSETNEVRVNMVAVPSDPSVEQKPKSTSGLTEFLFALSSLLACLFIFLAFRKFRL